MLDPRQLTGIRVLIADDDEDDWLLTKALFSKIKDMSFTLDWAKSYDDAITQIGKDEHDVYMIDYRLGSHTGMDILEQAHPERRRQPFILITGVLDSELEWRSVRLAASDYLVKGSFDELTLSRTLSYAMQRKFIEQQRVNQLVELNQAKDEFISIASHQLRTPATGVKQYLGMVVEGFAGEVPKEQLALLEQAYRSNERQLRIINDLLKVAQVDSGKLKLQTNEVQVDDLLKEVIDEQRNILKERSQQIVLTQPKKRVLAISFDADAIRMVFENIINNASKYSHKGSEIEVSITETENMINIVIRDEGVGINEDDLPRLFGKFVRFNNALSTKVGGTGLGLYWAKRIVDMHGGRIDYQPNLPSGSVFTVALPKVPRVKSEVFHT